MTESEIIAQMIYAWIMPEKKTADDLGDAIAKELENRRNNANVSYPGECCGGKNCRSLL